jgi:hypothetical protein
MIDAILVFSFYLVGLARSPGLGFAQTGVMLALMLGQLMIIEVVRRLF